MGFLRARRDAFVQALKPFEIANDSIIILDSVFFFEVEKFVVTFLVFSSLCPSDFP